MTDLLKMDIFFIVATLGVVLVTVLACMALWYLVRVLRALERIARAVEDEAEALTKDLDEARVAAKSEGKKLLGLVRAFGRSAKRLLKDRS